jgi:hypothetical protein
VPFFLIPATIACTFGIFLVAIKNPVGRLRQRKARRDSKPERASPVTREQDEAAGSPPVGFD